VTVSFARGGLRRARLLPRSFFGLSIEYWGVVRFVHHAQLFARAVSLLHAAGDGPELLRIGGDSSDQSYWHEAILPPGRPTSYALTPAWLADASELLRASQAHALVGVNAIADSAGMAAAWARAVLGALPPHSVDGFEVGNEPDIYHHRYRTGFASAVRWGRSAHEFQSAFTAAGYDSTFQAYATALHRVAPRLPVAGPAVANPARGRMWITDLVDDERGSLGLVTGHRYPLSACYKRPRFAPFPTIAKLLGERASAGMARSAAPAAAFAHRHGLKFRLTEFNSITCGGRPGVSNTFASALWAPDVLFELWHAGVDGANLHVRANTVNAPFEFSRAGLNVRPLMYGLITFVRALGPDARLVPLSVRGPRLEHLKLWAVRVRGGALRVLAINKGGGSARLALRLRGAYGAVQVERLLAPSPASEGSVTFAGQWLDSRGQWVGRQIVQSVSRRAGAYDVTVRGYSAALIFVR
jgi:hypothetical protein